MRETIAKARDPSAFEKGEHYGWLHTQNRRKTARKEAEAIVSVLKEEAAMTEVPDRVAKVLNEMFGTCMVAEQIEPVLDRLEQEGLLLVDAGNLSMSEVTSGFDLIE